MLTQQRRQKNTRKLAFMKLCRNVMFIIPVIALFFTENGLTLTEISLLQSCFSIALLCLEIPTGYISDRWWRKTSLIIGHSIIVVWYVVYRWGADFWTFLVAELILAGGWACVSGSDSALLYDTLDQAGKATASKKWEGRIWFAGDIAAVVWGVVGWFLGHIYGFDMLWLLSAGMVLLALLVACSLQEIRSPEHVHHTYHMMGDLQAMRDQLKTNTRLARFILFTGVLSYCSYALVRSQQQWLDTLGAPIAWFGVLWAGARMCTAGGGLFAHRYDARVGHRGGWWWLLAAMLLGYLILALSSVRWLAFVWLCLVFVARGVQAPLSTYYLNEQASSKLRATMLSSMSMVHRLLYAILLPLQGWVGDTYGYPTMFLTAGCFFLLVGGWSLSRLLTSESK
jgi:MFS family permease